MLVRAGGLPPAASARRFGRGLPLPRVPARRRETSTRERGADVSEATLTKYYDYGERAFADLTLESGERLFLSVVPKGLAIHRLHLAGMIPGRRVFATDPVGRDRIVRVLMREDGTMPPLPRATKKHRDEGHMMDFMDAAIKDLQAVAENKPIPGAVDAFDADNPPPRPLALLTRFALGARGTEDLAQKLERLRNIVS